MGCGASSSAGDAAPVQDALPSSQQVGSSPVTAPSTASAPASPSDRESDSIVHDPAGSVTPTGCHNSSPGGRAPWPETTTAQAEIAPETSTEAMDLKAEVQVLPVAQLARPPPVLAPAVQFQALEPKPHAIPELDDGGADMLEDAMQQQVAAMQGSKKAQPAVVRTAQLPSHLGLCAAGDQVLYKKTDLATVLQVNPVEGTAVVRLASGKSKKTKMKHIEKIKPEEAQQRVQQLDIDEVDDWIRGEVPEPTAGKASHAGEGHSTAEVAAADAQEAGPSMAEVQAATSIQAVARGRQGRARAAALNHQQWEDRFGSGAGFEEADTNADGVVDSHELLSAMKASLQHQELHGLSEEQYHERYGTLDGFEALDSNRDGTIDRSEWQLAQQVISIGDDGAFDLLNEAAEHAQDADTEPLASAAVLELPEFVAQELRKKTPPLMFMNDDGDEFELRTATPCDSVAASDYQFDDDFP